MQGKAQTLPAFLKLQTIKSITERYCAKRTQLPTFRDCWRAMETPRPDDHPGLNALA